MSLPLILIHGYPFDHTLWDAVIERLRPSTQIFAPDLPGFGGTRAPRGEPSIDAMADEVIRQVIAQNIGPAAYAGMSMGGYVALAIAQRYPDRVKGLGLISTHCWADTDEARKGRREMVDKVKRDGVQPAVDAALPKMFSPENTGKEELKKFPIEGAAKAGVEGISYALEAMAERTDRTATVRLFEHPVLIVHGAEDKFIPLERARQMAPLNPKAELVEIPNAGHATPIEAPPLVAEALLKWLSKVG